MENPDQKDLSAVHTITISDVDKVQTLTELFPSATRLDERVPRGTISYYNDLNVGDIFHGRDIPQFHRVISLPEACNLDKNSEYIMVNKITDMIQYYEVDNISNQIASILGISVLILRDDSISEINDSARHDILHSSHLGQSCFVASELQDGLCLALYEEFKLRFKKKGRDFGNGYHALVVPIEPMTLDEFVCRFAFRSNWQVCLFAAGGHGDDEVGKDDNTFDQISLSGVDTSLGKLIKLLNAFGVNLSGSPRRLADTIRSAIISSQRKSWDDLTENMTIASGINILLHHFCRTLDPHKHVSSAILIESLQDSLNSKYGFQDEWEVVDVAERINNAILLPSLTELPVIVCYLAQFTAETVFSSTLVSQLVEFGYSIKAVPSNSVALLLPLDNEKEREHVIHILRKHCMANSSDGPLAVSFGAQSLYEERKGEIIIQLVHWDICNIEHLPLQFTLKDCSTEVSPGSKRYCCALTRRGLPCKRMTFHESAFAGNIALPCDCCDDTNSSLYF
jgi:hypothetical protein